MPVTKKKMSRKKFKKILLDDGKWVKVPMQKETLFPRKLAIANEMLSKKEIIRDKMD